MAVALCHVTLPEGVSELFGVSATEANGINGKIIFTPRINDVVSTGGGLSLPVQYESFVKDGQWVDKAGNPGLWIARPDSTDREFVYDAKADLSYKDQRNYIKDFHIAVPAADSAILTDIRAVPSGPSTFITKGDTGPAPEITNGTMATGAPSSSVQLVFSETSPGVYEASGSVPKGDPGQDGAPGGSDAATASFVESGTETVAALDKGYKTTFNALRYGAVGDGATNDATAINAAITAANTAGGGIVFLPRTSGTYRAGALVGKNNVTLRMDDGVVLQRTGSSTGYFLNLTGVTNFRIEGGTVDPNGLASIASIVCAAGTSNIRFKGVTFVTTTALPTGVHAVDVRLGATGVALENCEFTNLESNLRIADDVKRVTVDGCRFTGWGNRAIYVVGSATAASEDVRIRDCHISDVSTAMGDPRQPIAVQGADGAVHKRIKITGNTIVGNGLAHHDSVGTLLGGTADQISLHYCEDFTVTGNTVVDGGEVGITVSRTCRRGVVNDNTIIGNNTNGIALGVPGQPVTDVVVTGNVIANNGQEKGQAPRQGTRNAIWTVESVGVFIHGNVFTDDQTTKTQLNGVYVKNSTDVTIGENSLRGMTGLTDPLSTGNTRLKFKTRAVASKAAATTRNNTATLTLDPDLQLQVDAYGVYQVEAFLPYVATDAADLSTKWQLPSGTMSWTMNAFATSATSSTSPVHRLAFNQNSTGNFGGFSSALVALPSGVLTVGATGGVFGLTWAQSVAEVSDASINAGAWLRLTRIG